MIKKMWALVIVALGLNTALAQTAHTTPPAMDNVVLIVLDGVRWQEVFRGMDSELLGNEAASGSWLSKAELQAAYGADTAAQRRERVMPFLWQQFIKNGQAFGNRDAHSNATVTNPYWFSYPGYNELLTGSADVRINSNTFGPNPNVTFFEWLAQQSAFAKRLGIYATWGEFHDIFNERRSRLPVNAGREGLDWADHSEMARAVAHVYLDSVSMEGRDTTDAMLMFRLERDLRKARPRVLFVGLGDSDNWAHLKRYDLVLDALHRDDQFIERLWRIYQNDPRTRGRTTFVITTDHGRGRSPLLWIDHGVKNPGSDEFWLAIRGPNVLPLGERAEVDITQSQIAATVLTALGLNVAEFSRQAAPAVDVFK